MTRRAAKLYYDNASKFDLVAEFTAGPEDNPEGVSPAATPSQIAVVAKQRFHNKFNRDPFDCPKNILNDNVFYDRRTIAKRLLDDGYIIPSEYEKWRKI